MSVQEEFLVATRRDLAEQQTLRQSVNHALYFLFVLGFDGMTSGALWILARPPLPEQTNFQQHKPLLS